MNEGAGSATLWIASGSSGVDPETSLLGLPLVSRAALAGERSGFARIVVEEPPGRNWSGLLAGTRAEILRAGDPPPAIPPGRLVVLLTRVVAEKKWLKELRQMPAAPDRIEIDPGCAAVLETDDPARAAALLRGRGAENALEAVARSFGPAGRLSSPDRFEIAEAQDLSRAEKWMLARLVKDTEGFMSRHVERRISLALSRRLSKTRVTPNAMTLVSVGVGLAGAALFLSPSPWAPLAGALLVLTHSILDGCDGELARLKFQESRFGGVLDFWGDNVVHCAVFSAIAIAWARADGTELAAAARRFRGSWNDSFRRLRLPQHDDARGGRTALHVGLALRNGLREARRRTGEAGLPLPARPPRGLPPGALVPRAGRRGVAGLLLSPAPPRARRAAGSNPGGGRGRGPGRPG